MGSRPTALVRAFVPAVGAGFVIWTVAAWLAGRTARREFPATISTFNGGRTVRVVVTAGEFEAFGVADLAACFFATGAGGCWAGTGCAAGAAAVSVPSE